MKLCKLSKIIILEIIMKKIFLIAVIAAIPYTLFATSPYASQAKRSQSMQPADCSHLSKKEQAFARNLSNPLRTIFCEKMTKDQRAEAMTYVQEGKRLGKSITPDQAVQKTMDEARSKGYTRYSDSPCSRGHCKGS